MKFYKKTSYTEDFRLFRDGAAVFWYALLGGALVAAPFVRSSLVGLAVARTAFRRGTIAAGSFARRSFARGDINRIGLLIDRQDEDLAVAHAAGPSDLDDLTDDFVDAGVIDPERDFHLGKKRQSVFRVGILVQIALLPAVTLHLAHAERLQRRSFQTLEDLLGKKRLYDGNDLFQGPVFSEDCLFVFSVPLWLIPSAANRSAIN